MKHKLICLTLCILFLLPLASCTSQSPASAPVSEAPEEKGSFTVTFITIGKGDAFLLSPSDGTHYMVDTGKKKDYPQIERLLRTKGVDKLEGIFLSHGHKDHAGGLESLLSSFPVDTLYLSETDSVSYQDIDAEGLARQYGTKVQKLSCGDTLLLNDVTVQCWLPEQPFLDNANNNSVILRLTHGSNSFLMMGDAEQQEEAALLSSGFPVSANVLKLGHHGENDASSLAFLNQVKPQYALITGNEKENPDSLNPQVQKRLERCFVTPYFSECDGLGIDFVSDHGNICISTVKDTSSDSEDGAESSYNKK